MTFTLPPLPYATDALEPFLSKKTVEYHYGKHHAAYIENTNKLVRDTHFKDCKNLEDIVLRADGSLFNNAAQALNHELFFEQFSPQPRHAPEGNLRRAIELQFGSVDELKKSMTSAATMLFGSGWVWLAADGDGVLYVLSKPNAGTPLTDGLHPLIAIDVWEHAYYIDYRNVRKDAVEGMFKALDWAKVEQRYDKI